MATVTIQERQRKRFKSYLIYYNDPITGEKRYHSTVRKKTLANRIENDLRMTIDSGRIPNRAKRMRPMRFGEVAESLIAHWENKLREGELRPITAKEYTRLAKQLEKVFSKRFLSDIATEQIREYRNQVADNSSNVNANRHLFIIKQIFKHGKEMGAIQKDPAASIRQLSEKQHERKGYLKPAELDTLIEASQKTKAKFYLPALICLGAEHGASRQEALSLRLRDIDLEYKGTGLVHFYRTKNGRERTQCLTSRTRKYLREWLEHLAWMRHRKGITLSSEYVFAHLDGAPIKNFSKAWREACKLAGFEWLHFHDMRHVYCSNLRLSGADLHDVKELIGHSQMAMTARYAHIGSERQFQLQRQLEEHYYPGGNIG